MIVVFATITCTLAYTWIRQDKCLRQHCVYLYHGKEIHFLKRDRINFTSGLAKFWPSCAHRLMTSVSVITILIGGERQAKRDLMKTIVISLGEVFGAWRATSVWRPTIFQKDSKLVPLVTESFSETSSTRFISIIFSKLEKNPLIPLDW